MRTPAVCLLVFLLVTDRAYAAPPDRGYDPLAVTTEPLPTPVDFTVRDATRGREIPVRVYLPAGTKAAPVVLISPGLGGSRAGYVYLARHWAARGYVAVVLQHPGSDAEVWKNVPAKDRMVYRGRSSIPAPPV